MPPYYAYGPSTSIYPTFRGNISAVEFILNLDKLTKVISIQGKNVSHLQIRKKSIITWIHFTKLDPVQELPDFEVMNHSLPMI